MRHTREPWFISQVVTKSDGLRMFHLDSETDGPVGYFDTLCSIDEGDELDANRIVACVNACAGLDPEAIPAMVEALERFVGWSGRTGAIHSDDPSELDALKEWCEDMGKARAALAKAKG